MVWCLYTQNACNNLCKTIITMLMPYAAHDANRTLKSPLCPRWRAKTSRITNILMRGVAKPWISNILQDSRVAPDIRKLESFPSNSSSKSWYSANAGCVCIFYITWQNQSEQRKND